MVKYSWFNWCKYIMKYMIKLNYAEIIYTKAKSTLIISLSLFKSKADFIVCVFSF